MNLEHTTLWPVVVVESDPGESEVEYSQAIPAHTMEKSMCLSTNASGGESDGEDERSCRSKRGNRRQLNEVCSVWSDARTSITSEATPLAVAASYSAEAPLTPLGLSAFGAWNDPPVESVTFDCNTSAFSFPGGRLSPKRRRLDTYSESPIRDGLEEHYKKAGKSISNNRLWSEPGDSEADGSDGTEDATADSTDSDLVVLSGLVARATDMLEDAVANRSDSYVSKFPPPEVSIENNGKEEVYDPHNSFKPMKRCCASTEAL
jgi:hypothetical protein